ncbi:hypothetical protein [Prescottella equi]|uniref:hypothetical protein n=1 Tax=Rhodococcus hoagii TaxID=43767 RepID=UPI001C773661|nr:hypothetical protein [Prescottella equi]BCN51501.1 hypothetical protein RE9416_48020 [Prescottella equi]BCN56521.1 hypothetical protein RE9425_49110 [Prescottella equi]BCN61436.1 hypothetical protein RE9427_48060 [Prescottella equi]BCN86238.1 hypothetical protein RE0356_48790 [Prescottella equi]
MSSSGPNPVLAPIRRWVLYSRTHLAITVAGVVALLFAAGAVFGETPPPRAAAHEADAVAEPATPADSISYDLDEVSESLVVAKSAAWAAASAPATAMAYAHAFVDTTASDSKWASAIGRYTVSKPGETVIAARPRNLVVITGPTVSTLTDGPNGKTAKVTVPTQAGDMQVSLTVEDVAGGKRWVVGTPLPTLDLTEVAKLAPATSTAAPRTTAPSSTTTTAPETSAPRTSAATPSTTEGPTFDLDEPMDTPVKPGNTSNPTPVPGPIPIPELDTPLPGAR